MVLLIDPASQRGSPAAPTVSSSPFALPSFFGEGLLKQAQRNTNLYVKRRQLRLINV